MLFIASREWHENGYTPKALAQLLRYSRLVKALMGTRADRRGGRRNKSLSF